MTTSVRRLALMSVVLLAAAAAMAPGASAQNDASVKAKMLNEMEVPAAFGTAKNYDFTSKRLGKSIGICGTPAGDTLVSVPAPTRQYLVDIETTNKKRYTEVMERVYQFPTPALAASAFQTLSAGLATCDGVRTVANGPTGSITDTTVTGSPAGGEYDVFFVQVAGRFNDSDPNYRSRTATLAVYTQAGDAVVETFAYINPAASMTPKQRNSLLQLAQDLSAKWVNS